MIYSVILFVVSIVLVFLNKIILKSIYNVLNPILVLLVTWNVAFIMHELVYPNSKNSEMIFELIIGTMISFAFGFWGTAKKTFYIRRNEESTQYNLNALEKLQKILLICTFLKTLLGVYDILKIVGSVHNFSSLNTQVRLLYLQRSESIFTYLVQVPIGMGAMIGYIVIGICVAKKTKNSKKYLLVWMILEFISAYVTMSKLNFILFLVVFGVTFVNNSGRVRFQKKIIRRYLPICIVIIVGFLLIIGSQRGYASNNSIVEGVKNKTSIYLASPMEAFAKIVVEDNLNALYVDVGDGSTNVFTWLKAFYKIGGKLGCIICVYLIGLWSGVVYNTRKNVLYADVAAGWTMGLIFMSFYSFLWSHKTYVICILLSYILDKIYYKKLYENIDTREEQSAAV